jgi:peptide/nickel transport system substrate-binding protein
LKRAPRIRILHASLLAACLLGCRSLPKDAGTITVILESSPNNLDLRQGTDAQSERVGGLIFDALVKKDAQANLQPWLATRWEQPDPLTWIFHLREGVRFHDGRPLEAADVAWTIESLIDPSLTAKLPGGALISAKSGDFAAVARADATDPATVVVHLKRPDPSLLFHLSDGLFGVVPRGSGKDFGLHPIGSGPFRFISQVQDKEVVLERNTLERNPIAWSPATNPPTAPPNPHPIDKIVFTVVPDSITAALELQKGSADSATNVLTLDQIYSLRNAPNLSTESGPGSSVYYLNFNAADQLLRDKRVRQAIALAMDRPAIVEALWRGHARLAAGSLLPPGNWAAAPPESLAQYPHDPARAQALLAAAGYPAAPDGVRIHLTLKTSTDETTRLLAAVLQQQLRSAGIALTIRSAEFGTFYADVTHGAFQMYILKWIGSNEDPDIFRYMYSSAAFPPKGANRGHYVNPLVDALLAQAAAETDLQQRRAAYLEIQKILSDELPSIPLWFPDNEVVHTRRIQGIYTFGSGNFEYLRTATVARPAK